jgi:hypothetical protein
LLVCAAGPLDTGQEILTYLFFNFLPIFIIILLYLAYPTKTLAIAITKLALWHLREKPCTICRTKIKRYKIPVRNHQVKNKASGATIRTYLFQHSSLPTRLVVVPKFFSNASPVRPPGPNPIWPSKARRRSNLCPCWSDLILTPTLLEPIAMHQNAWSTKPTYSSTCVSTRSKDKSMGSTMGKKLWAKALSSSTSKMMKANSTQSGSKTASTYLK